MAKEKKTKKKGVRIFGLIMLVLIFAIVGVAFLWYKNIINIIVGGIYEKNRL